MRIHRLTVGLAAMVLVACGVPGGPAAQGPTAALPSAAATPSPEPQPTEEPATPTSAEVIVTRVAPAGSVDMGAVTTTPVASGPVEQPRPGAPGPQAQIDRAVRDLSQRSGLGEAQIAVRESEAVEWSDSGLGCPDPASSYLQVITPGYRIVLEAGGQTYTYHTDADNRIVLCANGQPVQ